MRYRHYLIIDSIEYEIAEPKDFTSFSSVLKRDFSIHGVFFAFTDGAVKLSFVGQVGIDLANGRKLLEDKYQSAGVDAQAVYYFTEDETEKFRGNIDFEERQLTDDYFIATVQQTGLITNLKNRVDTKVSLSRARSLDGDSLTPLDKVNIYAPPKGLRRISEYRNPNTELEIEDDTTEITDDEIFYLVGLTQLVVDNFPDGSGSAFLFARDQSFFPETGYATLRPGTYTVSASLSTRFVFVGIALTTKINQTRFKLIARLGDTEYTLYNSGIFTSNATSVGRDVQMNGSVTFRNFTNQELYIYIKIDISTSPADRDYAPFIGRIYADENNFIKVEGIARESDSVIRGYNYYNAMQQNIKIIANSDLYSDLLTNTCARNIYLANGYNIRDLDRDVTVTFKDLAQGLNLNYCTGYGVERFNGMQRVRFELFEHFYRNVQLIDITNNVDYVEKGADQVFNEGELKYAKYANDEESENTIDDYCTEMFFTTPIKQRKKKFEQESKVLASPYLIEETRRKQFETNPTESWKYDDDLFMLDCVETDTITNEFEIIFDNDNRRVTIRNSKLFNFIDAGASIIFNQTVGGTASIAVVAGGDAFQSDNDTVFDVSSGNYTNQTWVGNFYFTNRTILKLANREDYFFVNNVIDPATAINLKFNLKQALYNWGKYINSFLYYTAAGTLQTTFYAVNNEAELRQKTNSNCNFGNVRNITLRMSDDVVQSNMYSGDRIFKPEIVTTKCSLTIAERDSIIAAMENANDDDTKNYGYISVRDLDGNIQSGFLLEMKYNEWEDIYQLEMIKKHVSFDQQFGDLFDT